MTDKLLESDPANFAAQCPACNSFEFYLVVIDSDKQFRVDCQNCGNVVAVGDADTLDNRISVVGQ